MQARKRQNQVDMQEHNQRAFHRSRREDWWAISNYARKRKQDDHRAFLSPLPDAGRLEESVFL